MSPNWSANEERSSKYFANTSIEDEVVIYIREMKISNQFKHIKTLKILDSSLKSNVNIDTRALAT